MSSRLDQEREERLQPKRMESCKDELEKLGLTVRSDGHTCLEFEHKGHTVKFWPYSGWHTGKSIRDGRGFKNLINQLKPEEGGKGEDQS